MILFFWWGKCGMHVSTRLFGFSLAACLFVVSRILVLQLSPCFHLPFRTCGIVLRLDHQRSCFELVFGIAFGLKFDIDSFLTFQSYAQKNAFWVFPIFAWTFLTLSICPKQTKHKQPPAVAIKHGFSTSGHDFQPFATGSGSPCSPTVAPYQAAALWHSFRSTAA